MANYLYCPWCQSVNPVDHLVQLSSKKFGLDNVNFQNITFAKCRSCAGYSQSPMLENEQIAPLYGSEYKPYVEASTFSNQLIGGLARRLNVRLARQLDLFYSRPTNSNELTVLDVGAGTLQYGRALKSIGFCVTIVDISDRLEWAAMKNEISFVRAFAEELPQRLGNAKFSIVHAAHVLEHVRNPKDMLSGLLELTNEGGSIHISFPNVDSPFVRLRGKRWLRGFEPRHLQIPNPRSVVDWLRSLESVDAVRVVPEASPLDVARWIVARYELDGLPLLLRKILMSFGLVVSWLALKFNRADRVHVFVYKSDV